MSGYPYGNSGGGYPPQYGGSFNPYPPDQGYQGPPPPQTTSNYNDYQSCASLYGTPAPYDSNMGNQMPNPSYGMGVGSQMPNPSYGMGAGTNYPPPSFGGSTFNPPPPSQPQYGGYGNPSYPPPPSVSTGMYPNFSTPPNYGSGGGMPSTYPPPPLSSGPMMQPMQQGFYPPDQSSSLFASLEQNQGTIYPSPNFNAEVDCQALRNAMRGIGTNEHALIEIATNRSNFQRQQIRQQYRVMFGTDLVKELGSELSGNFKEAMTALFDPPAVYDAWTLHEALNNSREGALREVILTRSNAELRAIVDAYRRTYNKDLEQGLNQRVIGKDFKRILISTIQAHREELTPQQIQQARQMGIESVIDRNRAYQDAEALYKAGAGRLGTDERTFNTIFTQRSYPQLRATFEEYQKKHRKDIAQVIRSEFSSDIKDAYLLLITCIRDRPTFFAERLHKSISGLGTRDSTLIRIIITRSEIDLTQIKQRYQQMYHRSLSQDVAGDTSGDYKRLLLAIIK